MFSSTFASKRVYTDIGNLLQILPYNSMYSILSCIPVKQCMGIGRVGFRDRLIGVAQYRPRMITCSVMTYVGGIIWGNRQNDPESFAYVTRPLMV